ncbi:phage tail family protein [Macrococcoides canis]|uniref:phage tail domain-containing protein n=1 Tax=Macrococcoides canis TaxID=1855823 RepID=UPI0020B8456A|nr:phage tail domain-containing protein [Macrococcus canis]UTH01620.1 phage tail family protein [Macrococcus canis]
MFKIYDLNFKEVPLPLDQLGYGIKGLDINIGPIEYENVYAQTSSTDQLYKRIPKTREVSINILSTAKDTEDWRLKRDNVYKFFRQLGAFYIAEEYQPHKLLKVTVEGKYQIERPIIRWGKADIPLKVLDTPFKRSLYTSLTLNDEGAQFTGKWSAGMGILTDASTWKYRFTNEQPRFLNIGDTSIKLIREKDFYIHLLIDQDAQFVEIYDGKNTFRYNKAVKAGDILLIKGSDVTLNGINALGDTNFTFLEVYEGWNNWEVRGLTQYRLYVRIKFLYD